MGMVGDDGFGRFLSGTLRDAGVDVGPLRSSGAARTALAFVSLRPDGEREFLFYRSPSADMLMTPDDVDETAIAAARAFHFGSISLIAEPARSATLAAVALARRHGKLVTYDPNLRLALWPDAEAARAGLRAGLAEAEIVKIGVEELHFLTGESDPAAAARRLWHPRLRLLAITRGSEGSPVADAGRRRRRAGLCGDRRRHDRRRRRLHGRASSPASWPRSSCRPIRAGSTRSAASPMRPGRSPRRDAARSRRCRPARRSAPSSKGRAGDGLDAGVASPASRSGAPALALRNRAGEPSLTTLTASPAWRALRDHAVRFGSTHLRDLFAADPQRFERYTLAPRRPPRRLLEAPHRAETIRLLLDLARAADVEDWRDRMFAGERINVDREPRGPARRAAQPLRPADPRRRRGRDAGGAGGARTHAPVLRAGPRRRLARRQRARPSPTSSTSASAARTSGRSWSARR